MEVNVFLRINEQTVNINVIHNEYGIEKQEK